MTQTGDEEDHRDEKSSDDKSLAHQLMMQYWNTTDNDQNLSKLLYLAGDWIGIPLKFSIRKHWFTCTGHLSIYQIF